MEAMHADAQKSEDVAVPETKTEYACNLFKAIEVDLGVFNANEQEDQDMG